MIEEHHVPSLLWITMLTLKLADFKLSYKAERNKCQLRSHVPPFLPELHPPPKGGACRWRVLLWRQLKGGSYPPRASASAVQAEAVIGLHIFWASSRVVILFRSSTECLSLICVPWLWKSLNLCFRLSSVKPEKYLACRRAKNFV